MEFLIFSDSHGRTEGLELALKRQIKRPDGIFFLGDGVRDAERLEIGNALLYDVTGNCDWFSCFCGEGNAPTERTVEMEGHRILMTHGHLFGVKSGVGGLLGHAVEVGADIVLFGHTHVPKERYLPRGSEIGGVTLEKPLYVLNPGSIGSARDGSGEGFATLELTQSGVSFNTVRLECR